MIEYMGWAQDDRSSWMGPLAGQPMGDHGSVHINDLGSGPMISNLWAWPTIVRPDALLGLLS